MDSESSPDPIRNVTMSPVGLEASVGVPAAAKGIVLFAHGSGSSRLRPRNKFVAQGCAKAASPPWCSIC